jgi:phenylacetate-CoA ligase
MDFNPELAFSERDQQQEYGLRAINESLSYLRRQSRFYRERLTGRSLDIRSVDELATLPFTSKDDLQLRNPDFLCVEKSEIREYTATSGTMGKPVSIALTENDLRRLAYNEAQSFRNLNAGPGDLFQLALTLDRQFMAGMAYYSGLRDLGVASVRTGPGLPLQQLDTAERLGSTGIVAVPSFLLVMAAQAKACGINLSNSGIRRALCIGESLRNSDFSLNVLGARIADAWPGLQLFGTYAATELQTAFTECEAGMGGHVQPDLIYVEIVDEEGNVMPDGTAGEIVVTTLGVEGMPLLRYKTGDIAALHADPCSCGRKSKRLGPVVGRKGQMIKYRGTTIYPPAIFDMLNEARFVADAIVEVFSNDSGTDELRLHIHTDMPVDACEAQLKPLLQSRLRVVPELRYHSKSEMQQLLFPEGSRKPRKFIDLRA